MKRFLTTFSLVIVSFFFAMGSVSAAQFTDVSPNQWFYDDVMELTNSGVISGYNDGTFRPYDNVTRVQAAKIIHGAMDVKETTDFEPRMTDLSPSHWAYSQVAVLIELGVFSNSLKFNPSKNLTRAEMAKVLVEGFDLTETSSKEFTDVPEGTWYHPYVNKLYTAGITYGKTETRFAPSGYVTRSELAAFVSRILDYKNPPAYDFSMFTESYQKTAALQSIERVDAEREKAGVLPVKWDPEMARFAQWKAEDMAERGYFSHTTPEGKTFGEQLKDFGISYYSASENIAYTYSTDVTRVYDMWMDSPGHRANLLNRYRNGSGQEVKAGFGAGIAKAADGRYYWVNVFRDAR